MNTDKNRELLWRTVPFVMAMLLLALTGIPASAIFGREKAAPAADAGAPIAQSIDVRVYRGIPYTGTLAAIDREGGEVSFAIAEQPSKGTVTLDGETFVYTSAKNRTVSPTPRPTPRAAPRPPRRCASPSRAPNAA